MDPKCVTFLIGILVGRLYYHRCINLRLPPFCVNMVPNFHFEICIWSVRLPSFRVMMTHLMKGPRNLSLCCGLMLRIHAIFTVFIKSRGITEGRFLEVTFSNNNNNKNNKLHYFYYYNYIIFIMTIIIIIKSLS